jgi:hypothetical protein
MIRALLPGCSDPVGRHCQCLNSPPEYRRNLEVDPSGDEAIAPLTDPDLSAGHARRTPRVESRIGNLPSRFQSPATSLTISSAIANVELRAR